MKLTPKNQNAYASPYLTMVSIHPEKGFAASASDVFDRFSPGFEELNPDDEPTDL